MGNHAIGVAFVAVAVAMAERRREGETALEILDQAADKSGVRGMDAEFDDDIMIGEPFANLIVEAFGEGETFAHGGDDDENERVETAFYEGPYLKFNKRYELC